MGNVEPIRITIKLHPGGKLEVTAPPDKILSLGMLELAKFIVANQPIKEVSNILIPTPILPFPTGGN